MRALPVRPIVLALVATAIAALACLTAPLRRLELWAGDRQARLATTSQTADDVLVVAIDEESLDELRPIAGPWPFDRVVFARVTDYLSRAGARAIVYDILFADERPGDAALAAAVARSRAPITMAAVTTPYSMERGGDRHRVPALGWRAPDGAVPAREWLDVRLPRGEFVGAGAGVANLVPDEDGVVRRLPLLHRIGGTVLPALPLAALFPRSAPELRAEPGSLIVGGRRWPIDGDGQVALLFGARPHAWRQVPFSRIAGAALARDEDPAVRDLVAGRTIVIGATALLLGEATITPLGRVPGLVVVAQSVVALDRGLVLEPRSWLYSGILIIAALAWPVAVRLWRPDSATMLGLATLAGLLAAWALNTALLAWWRQPTPIVLTAVAAMSLFTLSLVDKIRALREARLRLTTERVVAERTAALKSEFLAHVSHELRTPLTAIIGLSGALAEDALLDTNKRGLARIVRRNGEQLLGLVNNLLDQARISAGQMAIDPRVTSVSDVIEQAVATLSAVPRRPGVELRRRSAADVPAWLWIDEHRLQQIVINLLANALKFTKKGHVEIAVDWRDGWLEIAVSDTGPGIAADALSRIFEAFQQVDDSAVRKSGTGLGLTISRNLASLMGGDLTVESTVGAGSTFRLRVPAREVAESQAVSHPVAGRTAGVADGAAAASVPRRATALVADDSEDIRQFLQICLGGMGLDVITVEDGRAAVAAALRERPSIVLMDVQMPEMSGPDAARAMRRGGFSQIIVALTAGSGDALEGELLASGFDAVVFKPVTGHRLTSVVAQLLERGPRRTVTAAGGCR